MYDIGNVRMCGYEPVNIAFPIHFSEVVTPSWSAHLSVAIMIPFFITTLLIIYYSPKTGFVMDWEMNINAIWSHNNTISSDNNIEMCPTMKQGRVK